MLNKILIIVCSFLLLPLAKGQKLLDFKTYDTTSYVYKLDNEQMDFLVKKGAITDTNYLFTHPYRNFSRNVNCKSALPNGNYIQANINGQQVTYTYIYNSSFEVKYKVIDNDVIIFIKDKKTRENINTAKVKINDTLISFNEGYGGYAFDKKSVSPQLLAKYKAFLHVWLGEEYCVMHYNYINGYKGQPYNMYSGTYQTFNSSGYLINDKPVYRPGDTVRIKAFLVDPRTGLPITSRAQLTISEPYQNFSLSKKLMPVTPGAFVFKWKIPDTLQIDKTFQINFSYKINTNTFTKNSSFYLENYALNTNTYDASMLKREFFPGEDIVIRVRATDVNRFPLQGTQIHYKMRLNQVQDFYGDTLTISQEKWQNFFEKDTIYPYEGFMDLKIPAALLPNMDATYGIEISLTDPINYEQKDFQLYFNRLMRKQSLMAYQKADSVFIRSYFNDKDTARTYKIISFSNNDTLFKKNITTPYSFQLSPYSTMVHVYDKENVAAQINVAFNHLDISKVKGERSADSIRITFSFPFEQAIYYRILKQDKLIQQGKTKKLDFKIADNTKDAYTLLFTSNINNAIENNFYKITYVPPIHKIKLQSTLPEQAFPGQKLQVNVTATDCYNKPLENINIAAYAINKQFEDRFVPPQIEVPEVFKDLVSISQAMSANQVALTENNFTNYHTLKTKHFNQFNLYNNEYYQLRYPRNGFTALNKKIQSPVPEFAISVTANHLAYAPKYILLDGKPVYISDLDNDLYSFQAQAGTHQVTFRFFNKKITLNNITFEASKKYWLGFNIDSLKKSKSNITVVDSLPSAQPNATEKKILYGSLLLTNQFGFDSLLIKSDNEIIFHSNNRARRNPITLNIDGDYFYVFGPFKESSNATIKVNKKEYSIKVSSEYAHYFDREKQEFTSKNRGPVKGVIFRFQERQFSDYLFSQLRVQDTVKRLPPPPLPVFNPLPNPNPDPPAKQETQYTQRYNSGGNGQFSIQFKNNESSGYVKAIWLINKIKPEESEFSQIGYRNNLNNFQKSGSDGYYDLYFLLSNEKLVLLPNINFKSGYNFYVNPFLLKSAEITKESLAKPLKIYSDLTKLPLVPFYFPPEESNEKVIETKDDKRKNTYLHGFVKDESDRPLANVMIMVEVNGKFMYGAMTNNNGEYEILDMVSGSYQVKFYHSSFQIKTFPTHFFKSGYTYELSTLLKNSYLQKPISETIDKNYRFMAFNDEKRKNILKLQIYDKDTREALRGFTLTLRQENTDTVTKEIRIKENAELAFPDKEGFYKLEIKCNNYVPVVFRNLQFCKHSYYIVYLFMINETENPYTKKNEYYPNMQNCQTQNEIRASRVKELKVKMRSENGSYVGGIDNSMNGAGSSNYTYHTKNLAPSHTNLSPVQYQNAPESILEPELNANVNNKDFETLSETSETQSEAEENIYASDDMINQVINNPNVNTTRKAFSDVGYWQPNHITDKKGQVNFEIRLPDNITTWKSNLLAMGKYHVHGVSFSETRAYKPLQVSNLLPPFLWAGDKVWVKAKFSNLTKDEKNISASILINNQLKTKKELRIKNDFVDSTLLDARLSEPLVYKASLQFEEKYKDEEQHEMSVYNPAFRFHTNRSFSMEKDSTYRLAFKNGTKGQIILNNSLYEKIIEEINELISYEYACVEQTSSQLKALLCKERINGAIQSKENLKPDINRLIKRLTNYQNKNGTWGWWKNESVDWRMTIYATEAFAKANSSGYWTHGYTKALNAIKANFKDLNVSDQLYAFSVMQRFGKSDDDMKNTIEKLKAEELSLADKMYYYQIKETAGDSINPNDLYATYLEMSNQSGKDYYGNFFYEPRANLLSAYNLFSASPLGKEWLQLFKTKLLNGQLENNLNTYSKAALIEALTSSAENTDDKPVTALVTINDTIKVKKFPYHLAINRDVYNLKHKDATVFVNTAEESFIDKPQASDSLFKVSTRFVQNGKNTSELKAGLNCQLQLTIDAYRSFDYVMIEIPIPSGMRIASKSQQGGCTIEYYKNKIVVFYKKLNMQKHQLSFDMLPAFRGNFVWPAAKCSLMYYPYLFGNNQTQAIEVR